jgi:hypothetical protein
MPFSARLNMFLFFLPSASPRLNNSPQKFPPIGLAFFRKAYIMNFGKQLNEECLQGGVQVPTGGTVRERPQGLQNR